MKNKELLVILFVVIILAFVFVYKNVTLETYVSMDGPENIVVDLKSASSSSASSSYITPDHSSETISEQIVKKDAIDPNVKSFAYLFEEKPESNASSIVGYFAGGAFAWYVPDWLVNNWEMKDYRDEGMIFNAKVQDDVEDFGYITFDVSTSTELVNAQNLAYTRQYYIPKDEIIISEILLNKHSGDGISIQMETETRIYHITAYTRDFRRITDFYYMDGNGKTLEIVFESKAEFFPQFSNKIRDLVEGIGELKSPQG